MQEDIQEILGSFFDQTKTDNLKTNHFPTEYLNIKLKVGFGRGNVARIPWIAFLGKEQKPMKGIFPVYYFFKEQNTLILAYGISEANEPPRSWLIDSHVQTISQYFHQFGIKPHKYGLSHVYEVYNTNKDLDWNKIEMDLHSLIQQYKKIMLANK